MREGKRRRYLPRGHRYRTNRYTRRIDDSGDPGLLHGSGYARHELLFGVRCTAVKYGEWFPGSRCFGTWLTVSVGSASIS